MKRVFIATNKFVCGGVETCLLRILNNIDYSKFDVTLGLCSAGGAMENEIPANVKVRYLLPFDPMKLPRVLSNIFHYFLLFMPSVLSNILFIKEKYDVVIAYSGNMLYYLKGFREKKICWIHDDWFPFKMQKHLFGRIRKKLTISYFNKFDRIVCVSNNLKEMLWEWSDHILSNIVFLPNPIDPTSIIKQSEQTPEYQFDKNILYFVSVGRLHPIKGYDRLICALPDLRSKYNDFKVLILGAGEQEDELCQMIESNDLTDCVELLGYTNNPHKYVKACDVFICSSRMEGYSTSVSEAMILGRAIISTDCGGSDQILDNGAYGILTENSEQGVHDGLEQILSNRDLILKYQNLSDIRSKEIFVLDKMIAQFEALL